MLAPIILVMEKFSKHPSIFCSFLKMKLYNRMRVIVLQKLGPILCVSELIPSAGEGGGGGGVGGWDLPLRILEK